MAILSQERTFGMQVLQEPAPSRRLETNSKPELTEVEHLLLSTGHFALKLLLVAMVSLGFLYTASFILATVDGVFFRAIALTIWSCGFVPVTCYLWNS